MSNFSLHSCFSPIRVFNKYLGKEVTAHCGKCAYCLSIKSFDYSERVKREFINAGGNSALFITLTYDNDHLPVYQYNGRSRRFISNSGSPKFELLTEDDVTDYAVPSDYHIATNRPLSAIRQRREFRYNDRPTFAHLCYEDVQRYFAKLRTTLYNLVSRYDDSILHDAYKDPDLTYETFTIRYAVCGEYGPSTYRPHYHIIVWLNHRANDEQLSAFTKVIRSCWSSGAIDIQAVTTDGVSQYLASYVTSVANLPSVLQRKHLRPFFHFSQAPTLGAVLLDDVEISQMLATGDACRRRYDEKEQSIRISELPRASLVKYFPKCTGFSVEDTATLLYRYGYVYRYFKSCGVEHTPTSVDYLRLKDIPFPVRLMSPDASRRLRVASSVDDRSDRPSNVSSAGLWCWSRLDRYASLICYKYCVKYGICPSDVLRLVRSVYARIHSRKLARYYEWLNDYPDRLPTAVAFDPFALFDYRLGNLSSTALASYFGYELDEVPSPDELDALAYDNDSIISHIGRYTKVTDDLVKRKKMNDYKAGLASPMRVFVSPHINS